MTHCLSRVGTAKTWLIPHIPKRRFHNLMGKNRVIRLFDSTVRDGIQAIKIFIPTHVKIKAIDLISQSGIKDIEVASVVKLPQMKDGEEVFRGIKKVDGVRHWVLAPNVYGLKQAASWGCRNVGMIASVSEQFSQDNTNIGIEKAFTERHVPFMEYANQNNISVRAYLSCMFGYKSPDDVSQEESVKLARKYYNLGARIVICDTTGFATPKKVTRLLGRLKEEGLDLGEMSVHFHGEKYGTIKNIWVSNMLGINQVDTSLRGFGGCPSAKREHGEKELNNAPAQDLVEFYKAQGYKNDVSVEKLNEAHSCLFSELRSDP